MEAKDIDLKSAMNAISDVIQNRPRPLRVFDQIYMKAGDMVMQSEFVASWAHEKRLIFIGDGDAIGIAVAYLQKRNIVPYGPSKILVLDFDERQVSSVKRFADNERIEHLDAMLYNVLDPLPDLTKFDRFYTNPPWGQSNGGNSVNVFMQRGMEAVGHDGDGMVVIADDDDLPWPKQVLANVQKFAIDQGFFVQRMMTRLHQYHLDDAPDLRSCNLMFRSVANNGEKHQQKSAAIVDKARLANFYGKSQEPKIRYVREIKKVDYGTASDSEYTLEELEAKK
jgi:predicted methyltransferase